MKLIIESKVVKEAVVEFVMKELLNGQDYDTDTAKVVITKSGIAEVTLNIKQPILADINGEGEKV